MPIARFPDENTNSEPQNDSDSDSQESESNSQGSKKNDSPSNSLSSNDGSRSGRASGNTNPADRINRATGRQDSDKDNYKAPFNPDRYGVLGNRDAQQPLGLTDKSSKSPNDRFSLGVDSKIPQSGLRTSYSIGQDEGSLKAHVNRIFVDAATGLIDDGLTSAGIGTLTGFALGGLPGAAVGGSWGLIRGSTKGMLVEPIKGCVEGCHVFDLKKENKDSIINRLENKINRYFNFSRRDKTE